MKTIITSTGPYVEALYDLRFGRCQFLCILDENTWKTEFVENKFSEWKEGAGAALAQEILLLGIEKIISGDFGPFAQDILKENNIQMVVFPEKNKTVDEIIQFIKIKR